MSETFIFWGLPKPPHVKEMFSGVDGLLAGMSPGKVWIDHSTTDHQQNKIFTEQLQAKGQITEPAHVQSSPLDVDDQVRGVANASSSHWSRGS